MRAKQIIATLMMVVAMTTTSNASIFDANHQKIIGRDRYETATLVARKHGEFRRVILVNGNSLPDGLSASALAGRVKATILPVKKDEIPECTKPIVAKAQEVYVVGGQNAVSNKVVDSIKGKKVIRISGSDRCTTSIEVAKYMGMYNRAYLVNGYRGEADAMSISAVAARDGAPIILTNGKTSTLNPDSTVRYIAVGGRAVISDELVNYFDATRLGGENRYETNRKILEMYYPNPERRFFCNGETLIDALSASYMARHDGIVLVNKKENHDIIKDCKTVQVGGLDFEIYFSDEHRNNDPTLPDFSAHVTRKTNEYGEVYVDFSEDRPSTDKDGDKVTYEWKGRTEGDYYGAGIHEVYVRALDDQGGYSKWQQIKFTAESDNPSAPEIGVATSRISDGNHNFKVDIMLTKDSYDADTDFVRYEWEGRTVNDYYPAGENTVKVRAVDKTGMTSRWVEKKFVINDHNPTTPELAVTKTREHRVNGSERQFKAMVNMVKESTDEDGDAIEYVWEGINSDNYYKSNLNQTVRVKAVDASGAESEWGVVNFTLEDTAPSNPEIDVQVTRNIVEGKKFKVNTTMKTESVDAEGDKVTYEWQGKEDAYPLGEQSMKVRAVDDTGMASDWVTKQFPVINRAPTTPTIVKTPEGGIVVPGTRVTIKGEGSTDPDGDQIHYEWEGKLPEETAVYPLGKHVIKVRAVDELGAKSKPAAIMYFVCDPSGAGGLTLTGPTSELLEDGADGATITKWEFNVPAVDGHYGDDYGLVKGRLKGTTTWEEIAKETTTNGVKMSGTLPEGKYDQLKFTYYTNHDCMYNKSNITYYVEYRFSFEDLAQGENIYDPQALAYRRRY